MKKPIKIFQIFAFILGILYPLFVFMLLEQNVSVSILSILLFFVVLFSFLKTKKVSLLFLGLLLCFALIYSKNSLFLKIYPVMMNALVCFSFAVSLFDTPLITFFALKRGYTLTSVIKEYTKKATIAWAVFMGINTVISFITVFLSDKIWAFYNGFLSYLLIGMMFLFEYLIRKKVCHGV